MSFKSCHIRLGFVLAVASFLLLHKCNHVEVIERCTVDTLTIVRVDTIVQYETRYIEKRIVDTVYIETEGEDVLSLDVVQKHYAKNDLYDLWISGIEPLNVDSFKVYKNIEYRTINKEVVREVRPLEYHLYVGSGFKAISDTFIPELSISLSTPKKWLISANFSVYEGSLLYGGSVSYKFK